MWPQKWVCPRHGVITPLPLMATYAMLLVIFSCGRPGSQRPLYQLKPAIKLLKRKWQTNRVLQCELRHVSEVSQRSKCRKHLVKYIIAVSDFKNLFETLLSTMFKQGISSWNWNTCLFAKAKSMSHSWSFCWKNTPICLSNTPINVYQKSVLILDS